MDEQQVLQKITMHYFVRTKKLAVFRQTAATNKGVKS